jgi:predicted amidohydrolase YtcJ
MRRALVLAFVLSAFTTAAQTAPEGPAATLILVNGRIFTGDESQPFVEAIAVSGERITAVGTTETIRKQARPNTQVIDLAGRVAIPGINDAHVHPGDAFSAFRVNVGIDPSIADIEAAIASAVDETPADLFILATVGPTIINNPNITRATLDAFGPNRRILLGAFTGHGLVMSTGAMSALGIELNAQDPPGGFYGRDDKGVLNGRAFEYAHYQVERKLADMASEAELTDSIRTYAGTLVRHGITSIQAMTLGSEDRFLKAWNRARVPVRLRLIDLPMSLKETPTPGTDGVKWILDGTPVERGAALRTAKYSNGGQGRLNFDDIRAHIQVAASKKQQILLHASGDKTVAQALDAFEAFNATAPLSRPRLEHGDGLQRDLLPAAKRLGVVVVQNPSHFPFENAYPDRGYMLAKTLLENGIPLAIGSDGPLNPYLNIMEAVDRPNDAEEITREQAVSAYTFGSAFAEFKEKEKGKLMPGFLADVAVLSQDIFKARLAQLPETTSVLTIIGGKVVHSEL